MQIPLELLHDGTFRYIFTLPSSKFVSLRDESKWSSLENIDGSLDIGHQQKLDAIKAHRFLVSGRSM